MIRLIPATRAIVFAAGLVVATTSLAAAEEADTAAAPAEAAPARKFMATIYAGPSLGYAYQDDESNFAWSVQILARPIENLGLQVEYINLGNDHHPGEKGNYDGVYVGLAPMLPVADRFDIFAQVGLAIGDQGDDVAAGAGALYRIPFEFLETNNVDLDLRLDYKYLNWADGDHMVTLGFLLGFHK